MSEATEPKQESVKSDLKVEVAESRDEKSCTEKVEDKSLERDSKEEAQEESAVDLSLDPGEKSEDADAADDEESDSDESLPPGLLERPVEILENKRARKKITRFSYDDEKPSPSAEKRNAVHIPKGIGIRLKDHPRVEYQLQRNTVEDLKIIHKFFYGIPGSNHLVKKNIREFCGFVLDKDSPQYEKKEDILGRFTVDNLKWALTVLDVPGRGKKEELMDALMEWSLCPKPQDKPVPGKKEKKIPEAGKKKIKVKRSVKKMQNGDTTSDAATPAKKAKKPKKKSSERSAKIKLTSPKSKAKVENVSSDDEPLGKKKSPPTNAEIKKYVENLLKGADLEVLTMKVVFQQVYSKYPDFDLTDRKAYIKETVKRIIS